MRDISTEPDNDMDPDENMNGTLRKGSDPLGHTVRSKLQAQRQKLNHQINKEMLMRDGAVNLYRAATNRKLKEQVALELSFVNSNLQLLKEELSSLNSEVEAYQTESYLKSVPMIPLGLKETKELDIRIPFSDYILEHYSEDGSKYQKEMTAFMNLRQAVRTPVRNLQGIELLYEYYNQLYFVENRFFPPDKSHKSGIYFQWYDALTGVPSLQKSIAFEKGSILFNIGAVYSQMGARQDRSSRGGITAAVDYFQRSAGVFHYLSENFSHAPSNDMSTAVLKTLMVLMQGQAQECLYEKTVLGGVSFDLEACFRVSQEAVLVSEVYSKVHKSMMQRTVKDYIPHSWISLTLVKSQHFQAESQYYAALVLLGSGTRGREDAEALENILPKMYPDAEQYNLEIPRTEERRTNLGKAHLNQAVMIHEEGMRVHSLSKNLRKLDTLQEILRHAHDRSLKRYTELEEEDDFFEMSNVPSIPASTENMSQVDIPDFSKVKVKDLFHGLGPLAIFNARNNWTAPRALSMQRGIDGFGFTVRGDSPVIIASVDKASSADTSGLKEGDFITEVNSEDVKWSRHEEVVNLILATVDKLNLSVVTPLGSDFLHPQDHRKPASPTNHQVYQSQPSSSTTSDSSLERPKRNQDGKGKKGSLGRRKGKSKEKSPEANHKGSVFENKDGLY
ncbi:rhophilin-2-like [Apostichopus japonicus]|uniref:rhophilin-2-like n=1 Tax=Stichopus japonicus TaxID=307972 RepID=UPI003AB1A062